MLVYQAGYPLWLDPMVGWPHQATLCSGHIWWAFVVGFEGRAESDLKYWESSWTIFLYEAHEKSLPRDTRKGCLWNGIQHVPKIPGTDCYLKVCINWLCFSNFETSMVPYIWIHCASHCFNRHHRRLLQFTTKMIISPLRPNPRDISCIISGEPSQFLLGIPGSYPSGGCSFPGTCSRHGLLWRGRSSWAKWSSQCDRGRISVP